MSTALTKEQDSLAYAKLSAAARVEVDAWEKDMAAIDNALNGSRGQIIARTAARRGLTASAVRNKYDRWKKEGWTALVNRAKHREKHVVPLATIDFFAALCHKHQRRKTTTTQAWRVLVQRLELWKKDGGLPGSEYAIPGYQTPPPLLRSTLLPHGWSLSAFTRKKPGEAARALTSLGPKAYSAYLPSICTTRVGIKPGELAFFDDEQQDIKCNFMGSNKPFVRPLAFHALDCASGLNMMRNFKPMVTLADNSKRQLLQSDFYWFTVAFLTQYGWREDTGTMLVGELGTAAWAADFREAVRKASGGKVEFDTSGRFGDPAFRGALFEGKSCGNSRFKAPIESGFNLIRNHFAALPAPTGRNRDEAPEESYGLARYNEWCLKLIRTLPMERAMMIKTGLMEWNQFTLTAHDIIEAINQRTQHDLEGWAASGNVLTVVRAHDTDLRLTAAMMAAAKPEETAMIQMMINQGMGRIDSMSPREVWDACDKTPFRKLKPWMAGPIMGIKHARPVKVTDKLSIEIDDPEIDPDTLRFIGQVQDANGHIIQLTRGNKYLAWLNPYDPTSLQIGNATKGHEGEWLGTSPALPKPKRTDHDSLVRLYGKTMQAMAGEKQLIETHVAGTLLARTTDFRWNQKLADKSTPVTPSEKEEARRAADYESSMEAASAAAPRPPKSVLPDIFA